MMFRRTFKITYRPMRNNFVLLPDAYYKLVSTYDNGCLSLSFGNQNQYVVSWSPLAGLIPDTTIGINARVAKEMGLKENDLVKVSLIADVTNLKSVHVTPVSPKDWEIIDLSSEKIQLTLLDQTRVINSTQILLIWINKSMQVSLTVDRIRPNVQFGRIDHNTELIVTPSPYQQINGFDGSIKEHLPPISSSLTKSKTFVQTPQSPSSQSTLSRSSTIRDITTIKRSPSLTKISNLEKFERIQKDLRKENNRIFEFRVISGKWENDSQFCDVFLTKNNLPEFMDLDGQCYVLKTNSTTIENSNNTGKEYYVNVKVIGDNDKFPNNIFPTIELNENLMKYLKIKEFEKITLKPKLTIINFIEKIQLFSNRKQNYKILENSFKQYIIENSKISPLLLNQDQIIRLEDDIIVTIHLTPEHFKYCLINADILKECKLYAADLIKKCDNIMDIDDHLDKSIISCKDDLIKLRKFDDIIDNICEQMINDLCLNENNSILRQGNILIAGNGNSGKTVIVERIIDKLVTKPYCCFYDIYYCTRSKGRKAESIQKDLRQIFTTCLNNAPSLVVLENLDILAHSAGDHQTQDNEYYNRIADAVQHLIIEFTTTNSIAVIATCNNVQYLNRRLYSPRGRHLFHTILQIPELELEDREIIIKNLCSHIDTKNLNYSNISKLTEGYNFGDLVQFVERAIFYAYRINKSHPVLIEEHLNKSLENTNSYCMQGVKNYRKNNDDNLLTVDKIPGLEGVVTVLEEVLMWPSKYPIIFNDSPLRNQAGVLLFGPPGTGKTFLVSQIAHSWNLRTISVKGPELLAKYIGQSEENVRNLFNRARSAKPCVLFFDEFDSLAPKRGHDSTGVTDRVVNQLLTELDGVEGLQGVVVIAATSRPELLDPALLRSGRIDRLVECSLPNQLARKKIFKALSQSINIDKLVDFKYFAEKTENYTGADIQSILTSANMTAIKEKLTECGPENVPNKIFVTQKHLMEAFSGTRPSLSLTDISRYTKTYARFTNKEKPSRDFVAKRATLA